MTLYQPGVPTGFINLDQDYQNLQNNFTQLDTTFKVDHIPLTQAPNNGFHIPIHLVDNAGSTPSKVTGTGILWNNTVTFNGNTDEALFFRGNTGGSANITQITAPYGFSAAQNGYVFIPGGIIMQWGFINSTASTFTPLLFATSNINFPSSCIFITTQPYGTLASSQATVEIQDSTVSNLGFSWAFVTNSNKYSGFYWMALGF